MKLLLAEDEVDMSEALVDILTYHKYTVDAVLDGEEATRLCNDWRVRWHHIGYHDAEDEWPGGVAEAAEPR